MAMKEPNKILTLGNLEVSGGFATYDHRIAVGTELPDKIEIKGLEVTVRKSMKWAVIDLPNTFQPYIRIRVKK